MYRRGQPGHGQPAQLPRERRGANRRRVRRVPVAAACRETGGRRVLRQPGLPRLPRLPRSLGSKGYRRRADHHARPLASAHRDGSRAAGQAHLLREADRLERGCRTNPAHGRPAEQRDVSIRHAAAIHGKVPPGVRVGPQREDRAIKDGSHRRVARLDLPAATGGSRSQGTRLRSVAWPGPRGAVLPPALPALERQRREPELVLHFRLQLRHDRQLGRTQPRYRPVGETTPN